jgi:hypothetical protein
VREQQRVLLGHLRTQVELQVSSGQQRGCGPCHCHWVEQQQQEHDQP